MPVLAALFSAMGVFGGYLVGVRLIGVDEGSFWSQMQAAVDFRQDILNGFLKSFVFGVGGDLDRGFRGIRRTADRRGRVGRDHAHRGDLVARHSRARFRSHRIDVQGTVAMMTRKELDLWVGIFAVVGIGAMLFLSLKVANLASFSSADSYQINAKFENIGGLKVRAPVKSAGVVVGRVGDIRFDNESFEAVVSMNIDSRFQFPKEPRERI